MIVIERKEDLEVENIVQDRKGIIDLLPLPQIRVPEIDIEKDIMRVVEDIKNIVGDIIQKKGKE